MANGADADGTARALLQKHACLVDIQCQREREELANVRVQRITRWLILSAVAALLAGTAWGMVSASRSNSLVLEPLSVPPSLEARGLTGKVLSARLLDKLAEFQRLSRTTRANQSYDDNWQDDIKLDVGGSGFSIGETWLTMKRLLGRETRIAGEVTQGAGGSLTLTSRAGAKSGGQHVGSEAELDKLITRAAEGIYGATQPYRYTDYLNVQNRTAERDRVLQELVRDPDPVERKWAFVGLAVDARRRGDFAAGLVHTRAALEIDPKFVNGLFNQASILADLGLDEAALVFSRRAIQETDRASEDDYDLARLKRNSVGQKRSVARRLGDYRAAVETVNESRRVDPEGFDQKAAAAATVGLYSGMHDHSRAAAAHRASAGRLFIAPGIVVPPGQDDFASSVALVRRAIDLNERAGAAESANRLIDAADRLVAGGQVRARALAANRLTFAWPLAATGMAMGGRFAEADALINQTPTNCYECVRARGLISSYRGNTPAARRWLREAIRRGPSIPMAYLDLAAVPGTPPDQAISHIREAHERGPGWADPLKAWGDVLFARRDWRGAASKFAEAAERAPRWGALHLAWGRALFLTGRREEAREKFALASRMDLSVDDRARLAKYRKLAN